jgi:PKHD-type hydroxylase
MIYTINLLSEQSVNKILKIYNSAPFKQGLLTSPINSTKKVVKLDVKDVLQMDEPIYQNECYKILYDDILKCSEFYDYACPKSYDGMNLLEYKTGMKYKTHNDHYMMGKIRADYSCTIFLNSPDEYTGGELVISIGNQEIEYKLQPGQVLMYPTGLKHRVNEVISGSRKVAVFWVESCIQDIKIRSIYQELVTLQNKHRSYISDNSELTNDLTSVKYNMMRNFATLA